MTVKQWHARKIAEGATAEILLAQQHGLAGFNKLVVVKRILPHLRRDPHFVKVFLEETTCAARLKHPNIVEVYDVVHEVDDFYLVLEYVSGEDLRTLVRRVRQTLTTIPVGVACRIVADVAMALDHAHNARDPQTGLQAPLLHRDVSPSNILVGFAGTTKVTDFCVAKANAHNLYTRPTDVKSKLAYRSPEHIRHVELTERSDVFSLAVLLHELLAFRHLFRGSSPAEITRAVMESEIPAPSVFNSSITKQLDKVVLNALAREPEKRTPTARQFLDELHSALQSMGTNERASDVAKWMHATLPDAIESRRALEKEVTGGTHVTAVPVDVSTSGFPYFNAETQSIFPSVPPPPEPFSPDMVVEEKKPRRGLFIVLGALLMLGLISVGFWFGMRDTGNMPVASQKGHTREKPEPFQPAIPPPEVPANVAPDTPITEEAAKSPESESQDTKLAEAPREEFTSRSDSNPDHRVRGSDNDHRSNRAKGIEVSQDEERAPVFGSLELAYQPEDAVLTMDGTVLPGRSPRSIDHLSTGRHALRLEAPGHNTLDRVIEIEQGKKGELRLQLVPSEVVQARIDILTQPPGAQILVNGRARGTSPVRGLSLPPDHEYEIRAELDGYRLWSTRINPTSGANPPITASLEAVQAAPAEGPQERPSPDLQVPTSMSGDATRGRALFASGCGKCHGSSVPATSSRRYTISQWSRYFATGRHGRWASLRPYFTQAELADIKAYLMANAADVASDVAAGVK